MSDIADDFAFVVNDATGELGTELTWRVDGEWVRSRLGELGEWWCTLETRKKGGVLSKKERRGDEKW